jgi:hypothetical protein
MPRDQGHSAAVPHNFVYSEKAGGTGGLADARAQRLETGAAPGEKPGKGCQIFAKLDFCPDLPL